MDNALVRIYIRREQCRFQATIALCVTTHESQFLLKKKRIGVNFENTIEMN